MTDSQSEKTSARKRWELNREGLDALLHALGPDREIAGRKYEALRRKLIQVFTWERTEAPESLADETLNRLARRVAEGVPIPNLESYAGGIVRMLLREEARTRSIRGAAIREFETSMRAGGNQPALLDAIRHCLEAAGREKRELIERYYTEDRAGLARSMGMSLNALRNRAMRIRDQVYGCVSRKRDDS